MNNHDEVFKRKIEYGGSIEIICGSMFSGKTEELIRRINRARIAKLIIKIFSPQADTRFGNDVITSHNTNQVSAIPVRCAADILSLTNDEHVIGIDEAQFFDDGLLQVCTTLANNGIRVIVAGLDMDFKGQPFGPIPSLMAIADTITKLHAVCVICGNQALYSYRLVPEESKILVGEKESYEPRCRICYNSRV